MCYIAFCSETALKIPPKVVQRISRIYPTWTSIFSDTEPLSVWGSVQRSQVWYRGNWLRQPAVQQCPARMGFGQSRSEKWRKKVIRPFREVQVKKKWLEIEIEKWKWNENDWKSRSRSESEMKKLRDRDREVKFLENFREFKKDRFWSIRKGAFGGYIISLCNLLMLTI